MKILRMKNFLPEWVPLDAVLLALPHEDTDWNYILPEAIGQYVTLVESIAAEGIHVLLLCPDSKQAESLFNPALLKEITFVEMEYNDTWTRDYGPLTILKHGDLRALDFGFNGWGLKFAANLDNQVNRRLKEKSVLTKGIYRNETDFILEGGSVETDGEGTVLTTTRCLCSPNRNGYL